MESVKLKDLQSFARSILERLPALPDRAVVIALSGDLGAGKTTFVQALARELGVTETVQSPTYVLMKKYQTTNPTFQTLIHIDAYRLEKPTEALVLKPEQFLAEQNTLVVVEWPEKVAGVLSEPDMTLTFSLAGAQNDERYITFL